MCRKFIEKLDCPLFLAKVTRVILWIALFFVVAQFCVQVLHRQEDQKLKSKMLEMQQQLEQ